MKKLSLFVMLVLALSGSAMANPGTTGALNGVEDVYTGAIPPKGFYFMDYTLFYDGTIQDANGKEMDGTDVTMIANALRFIYSSDVKVLGGNLAWHTVIPLVHKDMRVDGANLNETFSGLGDIYVSPFILGWHLQPDQKGQPTLHVAIGQDIILPTGEYDKDNVVGLGTAAVINPNIGTNHYTFESVLAVTKMFPSNGLVVDAKLMYDIHTKEDDSNITTGDQFHVDFAATMPLVEPGLVNKGGLRAGINGYYFTSLEQDKLDGNKINNSKERALAIGPMVRYEFDRNTSLSFKAFFEQDVHNRPEGDAFWLKLVHTF